MKDDELKGKIMKLWKNIFHDSDAYISLVFDNYFNKDLVAYTEENGRVVSALIGVPYEFKCGEDKLRGLYLCGLATDEEYRNRGIMNNLIEEINNSALKQGYSFTFLIPSSDALINYYSMRGYVNSMYRVEDCYTNIHNFKKDYLSTLEREDERIVKLKTKYYESLKTEALDYDNENDRHNISEYIYKYENSISTFLTLIHSMRDLDIVIKENIISGGKIIYSKNQDNKITGVAFITIDYKKRIIISKIYSDDKCSYYKLLDHVKTTYPDSSISLFCYPEEIDRKSICMKVYGASNSDGGNLDGAYGISERVYDVSHHARPYGMIRILDIREILKFLAKYKADVKFSILVKGVAENQILKCDVNNGQAIFKEITASEFNQLKTHPSSATTVLNYRELLELLLRKKDSSNLIMEAFGIPRIPVNMTLMLD